jgi:hypothetical protein
MEETLKGSRGPFWAVAPMEREREGGERERERERESDNIKYILHFCFVFISLF